MSVPVSSPLSMGYWCQLASVVACELVDDTDGESLATYTPPACLGEPTSIGVDVYQPATVVVCATAAALSVILAFKTALQSGARGRFEYAAYFTLIALDMALMLVFSGFMGPPGTPGKTVLSVALASCIVCTFLILAWSALLDAGFIMGHGKESWPWLWIVLELISVIVAVIFLIWFSAIRWSEGVMVMMVVIPAVTLTLWWFCTLFNAGRRHQWWIALAAFLSVVLLVAGFWMQFFLNSSLCDSLSPNFGGSFWASLLVGIAALSGPFAVWMLSRRAEVESGEDEAFPDFGGLFKGDLNMKIKRGRKKKRN